jgi:hypothetical protein
MQDYDPISLRLPIAEMERWAATMVSWFEPQVLPLPVITIQGGRRDALGWFARSCWESRDGAILNEINFVPEHLNREVFDIAETLVHELTHLANFVAGIRDCSSNQYHNARFRERALSIGLTCARVEPFGWAKTGMTAELRKRIANLGPDPTAFELFRLPPAPLRRTGIAAVGVEVGPAPAAGVCVARKKKLAKWTCFGRCASVWAASGKELHAECQECASPFVRSE